MDATPACPGWRFAFMGAPLVPLHEKITICRTCAAAVQVGFRSTPALNGLLRAFVVDWFWPREERGFAASGGNPVILALGSLESG